MALPWFLELLELPAHADDRSVRRAYAARLKLIDPAADPAGFARLREAYETARAWVADEDHGVAVDVSTPSVTIAEPIAEPSVATPTVNPQEQATILVDRFAERIAKAASDDVRRELDACTAELRMQYIDAPGIFEEVLIDRLAWGLIERRVAVFAHASEVFHWQEIGHLASLGPRGVWIDAIESQRVGWAALPPAIRADRLALIERADAARGALPKQVVRRWFEVRNDFQRFPGYLGLYLTPLLQQEWAARYDALPASERLALERPPRKRRLQLPMSLWILIAIAAVVGILSQPFLYQGTLEQRPTPTARPEEVPTPSARAGADLANDLQVTLSESLEPAKRGKGWIVVTLTNRGASTLYLRKGLTPPMTPDGHVTQPLFNIVDQDKHRPRFRGLAEPKQFADLAAFYLRLDPGQTLENAIDLSIDYELVPGSRYTIRYGQPVSGEVSLNPDGTPHDHSYYVQSNAITMKFYPWGRSIN